MARVKTGFWVVAWREGRETDCVCSRAGRVVGRSIALLFAARLRGMSLRLGTVRELGGSWEVSAQVSADWRERGRAPRRGELWRGKGSVAVRFYRIG